MPETLEATAIPTTPDMKVDAATWFEVPTSDLERATNFYDLLLGTKLRRDFFGEPMSLFPVSAAGVGGALVQRVWQQPSACGALVYLNVDSGLAAAIERMELGKRGVVIVPISKVPGGSGSYAVVRDSEGNHIGLHER